MSISGIRVQRSDLPSKPSQCSINRPCVYRDGDGICDEPSINKGNGDAGCHRMTNRDVLAALSKIEGNV